MIFFTSDQHFNHKNIITYCNRPFQSVKEMNDTMIEKWNAVVSPSDTVYILGDFIYNSDEHIVSLLHGEKILILGDHDGLKSSRHFNKVYSYFFYKQGSIKIALFHWSIRTWQQSHYNSFHLYGHSHGNLLPIGKSWDVGVDNNNFTPVSLDQIVEIMARRPDNLNLVKKVEEQMTVQKQSYSYYGNLDSRNYDSPQRESGDWQGRP